MRSQDARRLLVSGRVQGVSFRVSTQERARAAGVAGSVRNLHDGRVEAHLEGPPEAVEEVEAWIRAGGPPGARVDSLEARDVPGLGSVGFAVLPDASEPGA